MKVRLTGNLQKELAAAVATKKTAKLKELVVALKANTPVDTGYAQSEWKVEGDSIVNEADYIDELNSGSSQQAPAYFIETTLLAQEGVHPSGIIVRPK